MEEEEGLVGNKFRLVRNSGIAPNPDPQIYLASDIETNQGVLIKRENVEVKNSRLLNESKICKSLVGGTGIPNLISFGVEGDYNILVMRLLGHSLEQLFNVCGRKFTLKTVLMLAFQLIDLVEFIHSKSIIHRDIRPVNFLMGLTQQENQVYATGFGLAKRFRDHTYTHIPFKRNKCMVGSARYASMNTLSGIEQSRRDDLESLGYVFMYFLRGSLPWQGMEPGNKREKFEKIRLKKVDLKELCEGYPPEFALYFEYCRSLRFDEKPEYFYLKRNFQELFDREGFKLDYDFDWKSKQIPRAARKDEGDAGSNSVK